MKRYKFLEHDKITLPTGEVLTRIQYTADPCKDMVGGYIEKEDNLPHKGMGIVHHDAMVYGNAQVWGGHILNNAVVCDNARIYSEDNRLRMGVRVSGKARICGYAVLSDKAQVKDEAVVSGNVEDSASVSGKARVEGGVYYNSIISGNAVITKDGYVFGGSIGGRAVISTSVNGYVYVRGDACIENERDICHIQQGLYAPTVTVYKTQREDGVEGLGCGLNFFGEYHNGSVTDAMNTVATRSDAELLKRFIELGVMSVATPEMAMSYGFPLEGK